MIKKDEGFLSIYTTYFIAYIFCFLRYLYFELIRKLGKADYNAFMTDVMKPLKAEALDDMLKNLPPEIEVIEGSQEFLDLSFDGYLNFLHMAKVKVLEALNE
ncbi:MAG: hypothetical protein OXF49_03140 [Candidatus Saccharibacteria bacterium]|nr:hypothetical protein [Candidatus Saccharibacteria bacterium]